MGEGTKTDLAMDRALGALYGLAIGDALGMPTQELDREAARRIIGSPPAFRAGPAENPISHGLPAGSVTDDTMQAVLIARLLIEGEGSIEPEALSRAMLAWESEMRGRGRLELLGPSTKRALAAVAAGQDPRTSGKRGTTNGAAMRIAPVGIATQAQPLDLLLDAVVAAGRVTHDTDIAHAGAAVVATVVSCGVAGEPFEHAALRAVAAAAHFGHGGLFERALSMEGEDAVLERFGTGVEAAQSVPAAFAIASLHRDDAWTACTRAAALGGDSDTIAALAGAMVGACTGVSALPGDAVRLVRDVNNLSFEQLAAELLVLRTR